MTDNTIRWLHLTDLHVGMADQDWLWPDVRQKFLDDLGRLREEVGPWDLVLFTGDLAQKAARDEYTKLEGIFAEIWEHFRKLGCDAKLLAVPGNHDVNQQNFEDQAVKELHRWTSDEAVRNGLWNDENSPHRQVIENAFENYEEWWEGTPLKPADITAGKFPGDFSWTFTKGRLKLGILGLNSAFLQLTKRQKGRRGYKGRLAVDPRQFLAACEGDDVAWAESHQACILMTHHPPEWLNPRNWETLRQRFLPRFCLHLCGHNHETEVLKRLSGGATDAPLRWLGRSLFGPKKAKNNSILRSHGYVLGELRETENQSGELQFVPVRAFLRDDGWDLVPDQKVKLLVPGRRRSEVFPVQLRHFEPSSDARREPAVPANPEGLLKEVVKTISDVLDSTPGLGAKLLRLLNSDDPETQNAGRGLVDVIFLNGLVDVLERLVDFVRSPEGQAFRQELLTLVEAFSALGVPPNQIEELRKELKRGYVDISKYSTRSTVAMLAGALLDAPVAWAKGPGFDPEPQYYIPLSDDDVPYGGDEVASVTEEANMRIRDSREAAENKRIMFRRLFLAAKLELSTSADMPLDDPKVLDLIQQRLKGLRSLRKPLFSVLRKDEAVMRVIEQDPHCLLEKLLIFRKSDEAKDVIPDAVTISTILNGILEKLESKPGPSTTRR